MGCGLLAPALVVCNAMDGKSLDTEYEWAACQLKIPTFNYQVREK